MAPQTRKVSRPGRKKRGPRRGRPPGRPPTPTEILARRGVRRRKSKPAAPLLRPRRPAGRAPAIPRSAAAWVKLLCELPGFDPFRDAGDEFWFDRGAARDAIEFFHKHLRHHKGDAAGLPFHLSRWQMTLVANAFGWKDRAGRRRFRYVFLLAGRKNGKTPLAAGVALYHTFEDGEAGAEVYSAGKQYKQAAKVFDYALGMVEQSPRLRGRCTIYRGHNQLALQLGPETGRSVMRPIVSDPEAAYSFNTSAAIIDELFTQHDRDLVEALETSTANRRSPQVWYLTTADFERDSICNEKHDYALSICEQGGDPHFLPALFYAEPADDVTKRSTWIKANPNLGVSVAEEYLRTEARRAARDPAYRNTFRRVHLCIRTQSSERPLPAAAWKKCARDFSADDLRRQRCTAGLDLAATSDTNALVLLFPVEGAEQATYRALAWFWVPQAVIDSEEQHGRARYRLWADQGWLRATPGEVTNYAFIRRDINELAKLYGIGEIAVDRQFQGLGLCTDLADDGFDVWAFGQGFLSMAAPCKAFRDLVLDGRFWHNNHPVLNSHAGNMAVELDAAGNMKPTRKDRRRQIDGCVSAIMALGRAMTEPWLPESGRRRPPGFVAI